MTAVAVIDAVMVYPKQSLVEHGVQKSEAQCWCDLATWWVGPFAWGDAIGVARAECELT